MKKIVLSVAAVLAVAAFAYAAGPNTIVGSNHDMTSNGYGDNTKTTEICVYCHTPHNAARNVPLWNRVDPSPQQLYNSATLTTEAKTATFSMDSVSAFCMSCHDGSTKVGAIKNLPTGAKGADALNPVAFGNAVTNYAGIGQAKDVNGGFSLKNDHPIGFSYALAQAQDQVESKTGGLHTIAEVKVSFGESGSYQPFFASTRGADQMECASCHRVHQPGTSYNFLRIENTGSALCLACHNK